jgi:hypothetical protein
VLRPRVAGRLLREIQALVTKPAAASGAADLAASFVHDALNQGAGEVLGRALERDRAQAHRIGAPPPEALRQIAPGELDFDLLEEATVEVTEVYDPEHDLIDAAGLARLRSPRD